MPQGDYWTGHLDDELQCHASEGELYAFFEDRARRAEIVSNSYKDLR